mgnify:CR=1 FL=1
MRALVTGAGGFIGSHLVEELISNQFEVIPMIKYKSEIHYGWLKELLEKNIIDHKKIVIGDITDASFIKQVVKECDVIFNLAALIGIPYSYQSPGSYVNTNIIGTYNILESIRGTEKTLVQTSTSEVYGTAQYIPIDEKHPKVGQSPYAATKISADELCLSYYRSFGLDVRILRPFNTYGPRQSQRAVIPTIIRQVLNPQLSEIKLGNLTATRDFNFVEDTSKAFIEIYKSKGTKGLAVNAASNFEISIEKLTSIILETTGISKPIIQDKKRLRPSNSEVERLYGCNKLIKNVTNWEPKFSGIDGFKNGLGITIDWFKKNPDNFKGYSV